MLRSAQENAEPFVLSFESQTIAIKLTCLFSRGVTVSSAHLLRSVTWALSGFPTQAVSY